MPDIATEQTEELSPAESTKNKRRVDDLVSGWELCDARWREFYRQVERNLDYTVNRQILPEISAILKKEGRPELQFNWFVTLLRYITGLIAQNNFKMKAIPIRHGDENNAELHTVLCENAMQNCDGDYEVARAFLMAAMVKIGWTNNRWDTFQNKFVVSSIDPRLIRMDPDTKQVDLSDCRFIFYSPLNTAEEVISMFNITGAKADKIRKTAQNYEGKAPSDKPASAIDRVINGSMDAVRGWWNGQRKDEVGIDAWMDARNGIYRVVEFHDKRRVTEKMAFDPVTEEVFIVPQETVKDDIKLDEYKKSHPQYLLFDKGRDEYWGTAVCPRLLEDDVLQEWKYTVQERGYQFKPVIWELFHPKITEANSILDNLISPADFFNQRMMTWLTAVMRGVMPDIIAEKGSIAPEDMDTWKSREGGKIKEYAIGKKMPEREHPMAEVINALSGSSEMMFSLKNELSGISPNSMGMKDTNKEGVGLFQSRVQAGMTMMEGPFSNLKRTMEHIFRYCDRTLQKFMTMPMKIRLLSEPPQGMEGVEMDQKQQDIWWLKVNWGDVQKLNDVSQGEYDYKPDLNQIGKQAKQLAFVNMKEVMDTLDPKYKFALQPEWIEYYSDFPNATKMAAIMKPIRDQELGIQNITAQQKILAGNQALAGQQKQLTAPDPVQMAQEAQGQ